MFDWPDVELLTGIVVYTDSCGFEGKLGLQALFNTDDINQSSVLMSGHS